jgi:hypothetical protein
MEVALLAGPTAKSPASPVDRLVRRGAFLLGGQMTKRNLMNVNASSPLVELGRLAGV